MSQWTPGKIDRFFRWLLGSPFQNLPPEFGDPVPPDLEAFRRKTADIEHHPLGSISPTFIAHKASHTTESTRGHGPIMRR